MADGISITDLEQKVEVSDNDNFAVDNGTNTNKVTAKQIKEYMEPTYVKKAGDTMTGNLNRRATDFTIGQKLTSLKILDQRNITDKNGKFLFSYINYIDNQNTTVFLIRLYQNKDGGSAKDVIYGGVDKDTGESTLSFDQNTTVFSATPNENSNSKAIVTTEWARKYITGFPNLNAGISFDTGYTAPSNGWVYFAASNSSGVTTASIAGVQVYYQGGQGSAASAASGFIPIKKGQTVTITGTAFTKIFYPSI